MARKKMTRDEFITRAMALHCDENGKPYYKYTSVPKVLEGSQQKITIICPEHGEFETTPNMHLMGYGCRKCRHHMVPSTKNNDLMKIMEKALKAAETYTFNDPINRQNIVGRIKGSLTLLKKDAD